jgi:replicative DNA helicase
MTSDIPTMEQIKAPPHSIEAEQAVLGGLMIDEFAWERMSDGLVSDDFYRKDHRVIFRAIVQLANESKPLDVITLHEALEREGHADAVGGLAYLAELAQNTPTAANIASYAEIVRDKALARELIGTANDIAESVYNPEGASTSDLLDRAESRIFNIAEKRETKDSGPINIHSLLKPTLERIQEFHETKGGITGLSTGFFDLDNMTTGLQPADLVIVAGRPSMGKTTFSMNIAENAALTADKPVLVFSLEMPADSLLLRSLSSLGRIDQGKIRRGDLDDNDWANLTSAMHLIQNQCKMYIDDTSGISPTEMRSRARRIAREHDGISLIVVDYLQLMQVKDGNVESRTNEISEISRSLKGIAKELNCPVIALSQLNRSLENRADRRPINSDLRESGAIEQDADIIMFVYRDEVYNPNTEDKGIAEIIIGKQRNGPIGSIRLSFHGRWTKFDNLENNDYGDFQS